MDAAVLGPGATREEAVAQMRAVQPYGVAALCVRPCDVGAARELTDGTPTAVCTVLAFPHGTSLRESKADEAARFLERGVEEIDMVANLGLIRAGAWAEVEREIAAVSLQTRPAGVVLKVILETALLEPEAIREGTRAALFGGADFVKTSTGFATGGASEEAVRAMVEAAGGKIGVKASGGIRTRQQAERFLELGATRLGIGAPTCVDLLAAEAP